MKRVHQFYHIVGNQARTLCGLWLSKPETSKVYFNAGRVIEVSLDPARTTCEKCLTRRH